MTISDFGGKWFDARQSSAGASRFRQAFGEGFSGNKAKAQCADPQLAVIPAESGYPVIAVVHEKSQTLWDTGSPAFVGDDGDRVERMTGRIQPALRRAGRPAFPGLGAGRPEPAAGHRACRQYFRSLAAAPSTQRAPALSRRPMVGHSKHSWEYPLSDDILGLPTSLDFMVPDCDGAGTNAL